MRNKQRLKNHTSLRQIILHSCHHHESRNLEGRRRRRCLTFLGIEVELGVAWVHSEAAWADFSAFLASRFSAEILAISDKLKDASTVAWRSTWGSVAVLETFCVLRCSIVTCWKYNSTSWSCFSCRIRSLFTLRREDASQNSLAYSEHLSVLSFRRRSLLTRFLTMYPLAVAN